VIDALKCPNAITLAQIAIMADGEFGLWIGDRKNRRVIPHRLEKCGYVPVRNDAANDGLWVINGKRQAVYAKNSLAIRDRLSAARDLATGSYLTTGAGGKESVE
jgi:hypothetical protein